MEKISKKISTNGDVGIWHETYIINKGQYENIYANMPPFLLGKVGKLEKVIQKIIQQEKELIQKIIRKLIK